MKTLFNFDAPINNLSLGNVSYNFLKEFYKQNLNINLFAVGDQANLTAFDKKPEGLIDYIKKIGTQRLKKFNAEIPTLKVWHLNGSERSLGCNQFLYTFYEVDSPTAEEINIVNAQKHVFFSSRFSCEVFRGHGCKNVSYAPLGFDEDILLTPTPKKLDEDIIHFGLIGKFERRKNTQLIITSWLKKFGNNPKYQLTCLVDNPFFSSEQMDQLKESCLMGQSWSNLHFLVNLETNSEVNLLMKSFDIDLSGLSNGEGWGLPSFNATALGKWSIVSNCSAHKDWANSKNSILVEPSGKQPCYDNIFFREGSSFNQGNYAFVSEESIQKAFEQSLSLAKKPNPLGEELQKQFTYKKTIDQILEKIL